MENHNTIKAERDETHIVIFPSSGMGHLIPIVEFTKRLLTIRSFTFTFITVSGQFPDTNIAKLDQHPNTKSITLPPVSTPDYPFDTRIETIISVVVKRSIGALRSAISGIRPISAFVVDLFGTDALDVAREFDIPGYIFFPSTATVLSFLLYSPILHDEIHEEYRDLKKPVKAPGCPPFKGTELVDPFQDRQDEAYSWFIHHSRRYRQAGGIIVNSFDELEPRAIEALLKGLDYRGEIPPVYPVGPLVKGTNDGGGEDRNREECLKWLDEQAPGSVLFVSFGSGGTMTQDQLAELALGLEASGQRFLWVVRRPHTFAAAAYFRNDGDAERKDLARFLPEGFVERTKEVGMVVAEWAPQVEVLSHEAVGGFLSHCGWNSTLESVVYGVPMIAWPLYAEQRMNKRILMEEIEIAVAVETQGVVARREEVERAARMLMEGEEGKRVRTRVRELSGAAAAALAEKGASHRRLERLAAQFAHAWEERTA